MRHSGREVIVDLEGVEAEGYFCIQVEARILMLHAGNSCREVQRVSDLMVYPWSGWTPCEVPYSILLAKKLLSHFYSMIDGGDVWLDYGVGYSVHTGTVSVYFDQPSPATGRHHLAGRECTEIDLDSPWSFVSRATPDIDSPAWLNRKVFLPTWWPELNASANIHRVPAYYDGLTIARPMTQDCDPDTVMLLCKTKSGVRVFGYICDLFDTQTAGVWLDEDGITQYCRARRSTAMYWDRTVVVL